MKYLLLNCPYHEQTFDKIDQDRCLRVFQSTCSTNLKVSNKAREILLELISSLNFVPYHKNLL